MYFNHILRNFSNTLTQRIVICIFLVLCILALLWNVINCHLSTIPVLGLQVAHDAPSVLLWSFFHAQHFHVRGELLQKHTLKWSKLMLSSLLVTRTRRSDVYSCPLQPSEWDSIRKSVAFTEAPRQSKKVSWFLFSTWLMIKIVLPVVCEIVIMVSKKKETSTNLSLQFK